MNIISVDINNIHPDDIFLLKDAFYIDDNIIYLNEDINNMYPNLIYNYDDVICKQRDVNNIGGDTNNIKIGSFTPNWCKRAYLIQ